MRYLSDPCLFPIVIIALFACAAVRYAADSNWPKAGYWVSAALLNIFVLAMEAK